MDKDKAVDKAKAKNGKEEDKNDDNDMDLATPERLFGSGLSVSVCMSSRIVGCRGEDLGYLWARTKTR